MKFFTSCKTLEELKAEYRRLTKIHHPDCGGDTETMKAINLEYEKAFEILKNQHNATHDEKHQTTETAAEFMEMINFLIHLDDITVELCGSWLWISGNTYGHKDELKAHGCKWSNNKKKWYWRHEEDGCFKRTGKAYDMDKIRSKYGSQTFAADGEENRISAGG